MAKADEHIRQWRDAGLIDDETAARIEAFESAKAARKSDERPGLMEALVYLGLAIIAAGVAVLAGNNWEHLQTWARVAVPAVPGVLGVAVGPMMLRAPQPGIRRGGAMAWLAAAALLTGAVAVSGAEADWEPEAIVLVSGLGGTVIALVLWVLSPSHAQLLGIAAGLFLVSIGVGANAGEHELTFGATTMALFGAAGIALTELGLLQPRLSAQALSALALAGGAFYAGVEEITPAWTEAFAFAAGAALIALSIRRGVFLYMVFGVAVVFLGLMATIAKHVEDPTVAALLMMLIGALLIAGVLILARLRPWVRGGAAA
jgi:uncharacterized membrane protein